MTSILIQGAQGIFTGLPGDAMRATKGASAVTVTAVGALGERQWRPLARLGGWLRDCPGRLYDFTGKQRPSRGWDWRRDGSRRGQLCLVRLPWNRWVPGGQMGRGTTAHRHSDDAEWDVRFGEHRYLRFGNLWWIEPGGGFGQPARITVPVRDFRIGIVIGSCPHGSVPKCVKLALRSPFSQSARSLAKPNRPRGGAGGGAINSRMASNTTLN